MFVFNGLFTFFICYVCISFAMGSFKCGTGWLGLNLSDKKHYKDNVVQFNIISITVEPLFYDHSLNHIGVVA